jgi:hypothetical protein
MLNIIHCFLETIGLIGVIFLICGLRTQRKKQPKPIDYKIEIDYLITRIRELCMENSIAPTQYLSESFK